MHLMYRKYEYRQVQLYFQHCQRHSHDLAMMCYVSPENRIQETISIGKSETGFTYSMCRLQLYYLYKSL